MGILAAWTLSALAIAGSASDGWRRIEPPLAVTWPRDHGAHLEVQTEWWYLTGEFQDAAGASHGFQVTIFRQGLDPQAAQPGDAPLRARHALAAHVVFTDVAAGSSRHVERLRRMGAGLAWASESDLDVGVEDVTIRRTGDGNLVVSAGAPEAGFALELTLTPEKPVVMHGATGVSQKGPERGNASAYASLTRLALRGTLHKDGRDVAVLGSAWFDHEWGTSQLGAGVVGWDWTGLRFEDGRELMLYRLRRADGSPTTFSAGTLVERDGTSRSLALADFEFAPLSTWTSPATGARYPLRWRIAVPSAGIDGELAARVEACEIDGRASTGTVYWEGPARVTGSIGAAGYLELSGYAVSLATRF
ncbi:MAG: carotenoid 1,2-hydratase [Planctomycetota bacterium]|nr:carotenoid 1,2-hydratase [Planctomycetota bacterium]